MRFAIDLRKAREEDQGRDPEPSFCWRWPRSDASRIGGVGRIIRDWVLRGPTGWSMGSHRAHPRSSTPITAAHADEAGPARRRRAGGARTWRVETFAISLDETTVELKALGFAKISARRATTRKTSWPSPRRTGRSRGSRNRLWWQDEARIGQKNNTRRWARRGTRPRAPRDQRTEWAYIFGAICPAKGKGAGLVIGATPTPWRRTSSRSVPHAVLIVDHGNAQAGDPRQHHRPGAAATIARVEPGGECLAIHARWLSNRIFKSYEDSCQAWNNLIDQPWKIMSLAQMGAWVLPTVGISSRRTEQLT